MASFLYRSERVGKGGKPIEVLKVRTLREGSDKSSFAEKDAYLWYGRFLRKCKLDELPQLWNIIRGDLAIVGPRPEEARSIDLIPEGTREKLLSVKPGLTSLSSLHFFYEEKILQEFSDPSRVYWTAIKPMKIALDCFYIDNKCLALDIAIIWMTAWRVLGSLFRKV